MSKDEADSPLPKEFSPVKLVPDDRGIGFVEKTTITETPPELALSSEVYEPEGAGKFDIYSRFFSFNSISHSF